MRRFSQGNIANHNLEHLTFGDRGVMQLRQRLRRSVDCLNDGKPEEQPVKSLPDGTIPTYCHDTVIKVSGISEENEQVVLKQIGKRITEIIINGDYQEQADRVEQIKQQIDKFVKELSNL